MVSEVIAGFGTAAQRETYVPRLVGGEYEAGSFALSEPGAGSDPGAMRTTAVRRGDAWVINGDKQWITSGDRAGVFVVWARTGAPAPQDSRLPGGGRLSRAARGQARGQDGHPRVEHGSAGLRGLRGAVERAPGRGGQRLQDRHDGARRRPGGHRRPGPRHRRGGPRRRAPLRDRAAAVRQGDRGVPGGAVDAGGQPRGARRGALAGAARGLAEGVEAPLLAGGGDGEALRRRRRRGGCATARCRCTAATGTRASSRWSDGCATRG
jgi:hypothetical protein